MGLKMKRGDVFLGNFDPTVGAEIKKTRPCVIVSNDIANELSPLVTVIPLTSQKLDRIYPHEVFVENNSKIKNAKIKVNQIRSFDKKRIGRFMTHLSDVTMKKVDKALALHLNLKLD
jgi:mRNA interferase MazF